MDSFTPQMARMLYLLAGEHSGDTRGAELMGTLQELRPDWQFQGLGGPKMQELSGGAVRDWVEDAAVVGIWEVLKRYSWFRARFEETRCEIEELSPDAVVFVDYPGFNLRMARALHEGSGTARLIDYVGPQVWAWNKGRIPRMAQWLDLILCLFPFEQALFEEAGLKTVCMGHPMVDQLEGERSKADRVKNLVGLFPGSREREVSRIFPLMVNVVAQLHTRYPEWDFEASAASEPLQSKMRGILEEHGGKGLPLEIVAGKSHELMQRAWCGVVTSGTATLEATYFGLPYCLVYKVAWPTYLAGRAVIDIEHLGMANILAGREIVHEFIQHEATVGNVASFVESVMTDSVRRNELERDLLETAAKLGGGGAAKVAAQAIVELLESERDEV
jgi:lipid-A-disaccharide synthase